MVPAAAAAWTLLPWTPPAGLLHSMAPSQYLLASFFWFWLTVVLCLSTGSLAATLGPLLMRPGAVPALTLTGCYTRAAPYAPWGQDAPHNWEAATPGLLLMRPGAWIFLQLSFQDWKLKQENRIKNPQTIVTNVVLQLHQNCSWSTKPANNNQEEICIYH